MNTVIVIPTYNEKENIVKIIDALMYEFRKIEQNKSYSMHILVVDDNSPDGTGNIVEEITKNNKNVSLIRGKKQGLGKAYIRGFMHAIISIQADIVMQMDADFSHNPKDVIRLLKPIYNDNADVVIGSRYAPGGSIPANWGIRRKLNSLVANIIAKYVSGIKNIHDCTAGFRAIRTSILREISFDQLKVEGYAFQMNLLYAIIKYDGIVVEVPVHFVDRTIGESKIRLKDILEFIMNAVILRTTQIKNDLEYGYFETSDRIENLLPDILKGGGLIRKLQ